MNMFATATSRISFLGLCLVCNVISSGAVESSSTTAVIADAIIVCAEEQKLPVDKWFLATVQGGYDDFEDSSLAMIEAIFLDAMTSTADSGSPARPCFQSIEKVSALALDPEEDSPLLLLAGGSAKIKSDGGGSRGLSDEFLISIQAQGFKCGDCDESISPEDINTQERDDMEMETLLLLLKEKVNSAFTSYSSNNGRASESSESVPGKEMI
jgi:hypothetical protein